MNKRRWLCGAGCASLALAASFWIPVVDVGPAPRAAPVNTLLDPVGVRREETTTPKSTGELDVVSARIDAGSASLPFVAQSRRVQDGKTVVRIATSTRQFDVWDGDTVEGSYILHSTPEHVRFTHRVTGRQHLVPLPADCQEMREPVANAAAGLPPAPVAIGSVQETDAERDARED